MSGVLSRLRRHFVTVAARRPTGWLGRFIYGTLARADTLGDTAIERLRLRSDDRYLEIGQGGGLLLRRVLETVERGAAIDHSPDTVEIARRNNRVARAAGRAEIVEGHAAHLPWPDGHFTCCACVATFLFLPDPMAALAEMRRVLAPGGRLVIITPASRAPAFVRSMHSGGDDAARLYSRAELAQMLAEAGFGSIAVDLASKRLVAYAEVPRPAP